MIKNIGVIFILGTSIVYSLWACLSFPGSLDYLVNINLAVIYCFISGTVIEFKKGEEMIRDKIEALILDTIYKIVETQNKDWSIEAKKEDMRLELWKLVRNIMKILIERLTCD